MDTFLSAMSRWNKKLETFIEENKKIIKNKVGERSQILLTVPKGMEQEFKDLAKLRREQADDAHKARGPESVSLALKFERDNPPPRRSDYE